MTGRETPKYPTLTGKVDRKHNEFFKETAITGNNELHMWSKFSYFTILLPI